MRHLRPADHVHLPSCVAVGPWSPSATVGVAAVTSG
ncbi:hypothetical protein Ae406Ps2_3424c [Pseudonocardia sp. Ae406_Ps2]|nr:hypothetical protein Ae331Ps2_2503 [Pseudonocardia sp. Ae331_Ps2]OLM03424.1 hypothetical protein Ae406Ps2_3424c [Pseudonocardia sp. Ae406_Ps2]OLM11688.1 hypothetical protein Ae505Ps2_1813 [Pseudonocardia sp. Ae505_Ps2]OLM24983.1 hypothetical protein Ae706Ps2_3416c [Pseudonocardia sp. Ae706_Ps2]